MNKIAINRGRSKTIRVPVICKDGSTCVLSDDDIIRFAVKAHEDGEALIKKTLEYDKENNKATLNLVPSDTADMDCDRYFYDIGVDFANGDYRDIISWAEFEVLPSAAGKEPRTSKGCESNENI